MGHLTGYAIGSLDLRSILGDSLGNTQFKQMTAISVFGFVVTVTISSYAVTERILIDDGYVIRLSFLFPLNTFRSSLLE